MGYKRKYGPIEKQFTEAYTLNGSWKLKLLEFGELKLKSLRKNKIYKRFFASKINRLIHLTN
jgi:hypothetical protein